MVGFIFSLLEGHHNPCLQILLRTFRTKYAILLFILEGDNPDYIFQFFLVNLKKGTGTCVLLWSIFERRDNLVACTICNMMSFIA